MQKITLIAAMGENHCIGIHNTMPWHIPEDFAFFKAYTLNKPVIMGRKTWESLPKKPLPERRNIIISRQTDYACEGAEKYQDFQAALNACADATEIIIMGGAEIYQQALAYATDLRLTEVKLSPQGDAFFPQFSKQDWQEKERTSHQSLKNISFDFVHYIKK